MRSVSWLMMMAARSRSLFHESGHNGVECRNKSVTESVSPDLWTVVNLCAALLQTAPTMADFGWPWLSADAVGSPPGVAGGSALFSFSTSSLFIPFSPFPMCLEIASLPPSLPGPADADPPLQDLCVWPVGFQRYTCCFWNVVWIQAASCLVFASTAYFFLMTWSLMVLVDGFRDGVMNLWPPCSWLVCRLCVASCVVSVVLQFKSCALHFILICNWDVFCAVICVSVFLLFWSCRTVDLPSLLPLMVSADIV